MFVSKAQQRWAHTPAGIKALGGKSKVKEWEDATNYSKLPERVQHFSEGGLVEPDEDHNPLHFCPELMNFEELW